MHYIHEDNIYTCFVDDKLTINIDLPICTNEMFSITLLKATKNCMALNYSLIYVVSEDAITNDWEYYESMEDENFGDTSDYCVIDIDNNGDIICVKKDFNRDYPFKEYNDEILKFIHEVKDEILTDILLK